MAKKTYLFAVQKETGHEVLSAKVETAKVSEVEAQRLPDGTVRLLEAGKVIATGTGIVAEEDEVKLYRWPATDKTGKAVEKPVERL